MIGMTVLTDWTVNRITASSTPAGRGYGLGEPMRNATVLFSASTRFVHQIGRRKALDEYQTRTPW